MPLPENPPEFDRTDLSEHDLRLLYQAASIGLQRLGQDFEKSEPPKHWLWRFFESSLGTAFITVFIGGLFAAWISAGFQQSAKEREFQQALLKARTDQALIIYKDFTEKREEFIKSTFETVGETVNATANYELLANSDTRVKEEDSAAVGIEKKKIIDEVTNRFFQSKNNWQKTQAKINSSILYYFPKQPALSQAYQKMSISLTAYTDCAARAFSAAPDSCKSEKNGVDADIAELNSLFEQLRTYAWQELNDPQKTKEFIDEISKPF
jgi:hypothetical protein